ncbi:MAG: MurT ligase domain-containing protein [Sphingomonadaceae bacterium]
MRPRLTAAVAAGRLATVLSRRLGVGGGTTAPGHLVRVLDPSAVSSIAARISRGSIVVTGTNGKTTTTRMISTLLRKAGLRVMHNRSGANLMAGIASALVNHSTLAGRPMGDVGLFEVDEAAFPAAVRQLQPRLCVLTNLFRDQLDRYGEVDYLSRLWRETLSMLPPSSTVLLNVDDPRIAGLGEGVACRVLYYGIEDPSIGGASLSHAADSRFCIRCGAPYSYPLVFYSHLGHYHCPSCGVARPAPHWRAVSCRLLGTEGTRLQVEGPAGGVELQLRIPGLYNVYNALAAVGVGAAMGVDLETIRVGLGEFSAAFGRVERVEIQGRRLFLALVKNPVGFNQVLSTILAEPGEKRLMIVINDLFADGTDVSWLWDVDFEMLAGRVRFAVASGLRAEDMAVRLKYAGVDPQRIAVEGDSSRALQRALQETAEGDTLYLLPTYTAMLEVRGRLAEAGQLPPFWED